MKPAERVGQQQPGRGHVQQLNTTLSEVGQRLYDIEVVQQAVDQGHHCIQDTGFAIVLRHYSLLPG